MSTIARAFENGKAFIPFITCGDPDLETTEQLIYVMERAGADLIELGIPFSDPTAEGPVIQEANIRSLSSGTTTDKVFDLVQKVRTRSAIPLAFMTYANVVFTYGAEAFFARCQSVGVDGIILTKLDGDSRGGAALSVKAVTGKPIKFAGVGEKIEDLEPFYPDRMASRILGMGDILSLIEKASTGIDEQKAMKMVDKLRRSEMDFNDLLDQMDELKKMGPLSSVMNMIPGAAGKMSDEDAERSEKEMARSRAIIYSMTPAERAKPSLIDPKRKRRIAAGSGTKVEDVNRLLRQLEQSRKLMKMMTGKGGKKAKRMGFPGGFPGGMPGMM